MNEVEPRKSAIVIGEESVDDIISAGNELADRFSGFLDYCGEDLTRGSKNVLKRGMPWARGMPLLIGEQNVSEE